MGGVEAGRVFLIQACLLRTQGGPRAARSASRRTRSEPRAAQDGPRATQTGPRAVQRPSWSHLGSFLETSEGKKHGFCLGFPVLFEHSRFSQEIDSEGILEANLDQLGARRAAQERPRAPQERPRAPQEWPRATQERPKSGQERPKSGQQQPKSCQEDPKSAQEQSKKDHER